MEKLRIIPKHSTILWDKERHSDNGVDDTKSEKGLVGLGEEILFGAELLGLKVHGNSLDLDAKVSVDEVADDKGDESHSESNHKHLLDSISKIFVSRYGDIEVIHYCR